MIEYIQNAIKLTAGEEVTITAEITDDNGATITENCYLTLYDDAEELVTIAGLYSEPLWAFTIPAEVTANREGRYWYSICYCENALLFKQPLYLV